MNVSEGLQRKGGRFNGYAKREFAKRILVQERATACDEIRSIQNSCVETGEEGLLARTVRSSIPRPIFPRVSGVRHTLSFLKGRKS